MSYYPTGYYPTGYYPTGYYPDGGATVTPTTCTGGLISLDTARIALGYTDSETQDDTVICGMIQAATKRFERATGTPIVHDAARVLEFTGTGKATWIPPVRQVNSVSVLEYWSGLAWVAIDTARYRVIQPGGIWQIEFLSYFSSSTQYRATLDVGYSDIPDDIQEIVTSAVILAYMDRGIGKGESRLGIQSKADGAGTGDRSITVTYSRDEHNRVWKSTVSSYRAYNV